ncbi:MAG: cobalt-precorrin-5B (C(1))-methyltransferase CbiD [Bacteroidales bacterium]|nr:cobalt-precorrin-5B (C(1))-methyltransferase CbiD [Bacteroidales bacterium]
MILILGGTTEGRLAVRVADGAGSPYWYSTRGELQQIECKNGTHITGALDEAAMAAFCRDHDIRLLIDAAHPFATELHRTVAAVAESLDLPIVRVERVYSDGSGESGSARASLRWCDDYTDAVRQMEADGVTRLLALTGVQTIGKLRPYWSAHDCWFRILRRDESLEKAVGQGFPVERLVYYEEEDDASLIARLRPQAILTKDSGESGGFNEKVAAAQAAGIPVYVVRRPALPAGFETVTGEHGLRKAIERLVPGFFPLRSGFTTGACATAAAKAALLSLLGQPVGASVEVLFPDGEILSLPIADVRNSQGPACAGLVERRVLSGRALDRPEKVPTRAGKQATVANSATAVVIKDAGDDPDVTNGQEIVATVAFSEELGIHFLQGEGVGRVTLPGLGLPIGGPAINRVPRQMMEQNLSALYAGGLDVTISVPGGRELARRTFNPKLGIVDGISIIGTSGIVRPFSNEAFVDAIRREIEVAVAVGAPMLVINSGAKSEAFLKARFPDLPPQAFVHYGNFIGETLKIAADLQVAQVTMGIMLGKAVKLAEGHLDTHSKSVVMNKGFLKEVAASAGCAPTAADAIESLTLARELWHGLPPADLNRFLSAILGRCRATCASVYPASLTILLLDEDGNVFQQNDGLGKSF